MTATRVGTVGCHAHLQKWYNFLIRIWLLHGSSQRTTWQPTSPCWFEPIWCNKVDTATWILFDVPGWPTWSVLVVDSLLRSPLPPPAKLNISAQFQGRWTPLCPFHHHHPWNHVSAWFQGCWSPLCHHHCHHPRNQVSQLSFRGGELPSASSTPIHEIEHHGSILRMVDFCCPPHHHPQNLVWDRYSASSFHLILLSCSR